MSGRQFKFLEILVGENDLLVTILREIYLNT